MIVKNLYCVEYLVCNLENDFYDRQAEYFTDRAEALAFSEKVMLGGAYEVVVSVVFGE